MSERCSGVKIETRRHRGLALMMVKAHALAAVRATVIAVCCFGVACGGGGGGFSGNGGMMGGGGLAANFSASNANPGALTISMAPGASSDTTFAVEILVTDIDDFFGAAFRVTFDDSVSSFDGFSSAGSFISGGGVTTDFRAEIDATDSGLILITATRQGQFAGVDANGSQLLLTLNFTANGANAGSAFNFGAAATRQVTTCPTPPAACTDLSDASLTWSGGTLTVN